MRRARRDLLRMLTTPGAWEAAERARARTYADGAGIEALVRALADDDNDTRLKAALSLGAWGDVRAIGGLIQALQDRDPPVRAAAARALGRLRNALAVQPLLATLKDADGAVLRTAALALGEVGHPSAIDGLARVLEDPDPVVSPAAAGALVRLGPAGVEHVLSALGHGTPWVRVVASFALGESGDPQVVEPLLGVLETPGHPGRADAARALGHLRDARAVPKLMAALGSEDVELRRASVWALERIDPPAAIALEELERRARRDTDGRVRNACQRGVRRIQREQRRGPKELQAAGPPKGTGTEPEAVSAPAGRGTEPEAEITPG